MPIQTDGDSLLLAVYEMLTDDCKQTGFLGYNDTGVFTIEHNEDLFYSLLNDIKKHVDSIN